MQTRVYAYGCKRPRDHCLDRVEEQYRLAHQYQNRVIEIFRKKFEEYVQARDRRSQPLVAARTEYDRLRAELAAHRAAIKAKSAQARKRVPPSPADKAHAAALVERVVLAKDQMKAAREAAKLDGGLAAEAAEIQGRADDAYKALYNAPEFAGLFWGTKNHVKDRVIAAQKTTKGPIRFRRWSRDGVLYCQVMGGIPAEKAFVEPGNPGGKGDTRVQVDRVPGQRTRAVVRVRIGSAGPANREPVWAEVSAAIHRPFPPGATIVGVQLVRRAGVWHRMSDGQWRPRDKYQVQFQLNAPSFPGRTAETGAVAVDLGWREIDGDLRVAYLVSHPGAFSGLAADPTVPPILKGLWFATAGDGGEIDGSESELRLPARLLARWAKAEDLQSIRDKAFNAIRDRLVEYLAAPGDKPPALLEAAKFLPQWRSIDRLCRLLAGWERHPGDDQVYADLQAWRAREAHLHQYQVGTVGRAERIRRDIYRCLAKAVSARFRTVVVEDMNVRKLMTEKPPEADAAYVPKKNRNPAASGYLRATLAAAAAEAVRAPTAGSTSTCFRCGATYAGNRSAVVLTCQGCGASWDQDANAARNLLRWYRERPADGADPAREAEVATEEGDADGFEASGDD